MGNRSEKYLQAIWDATEALQDEKQMENGLSSCLSILGDVIDCEYGFAWIFDQADNRLYVVACYGPTDVTGVSVSDTQGVVGRVFHTQNPEIIRDCSADVRYSSVEDEETGLPADNMICVPLKTKTAVYGCLQLTNKQSGAFNENDAMLCSNISALVALDIEDKGYIVRMGKKDRPIICLQNVTKSFPSGDTVLKVLNGIDLEIYEGEFLVVLGESGCGKSTMLNIIGGMDSLTDGVFTVDGVDFSHPSDKELTMYRRDYIGFIFQSYNLMPNLTAQENIEFVSENSKEPIPAADALAQVGLSDRAGNFPSQMSGGQQQRVSIARALAKNPRVILADEPTAALDYTTSIEVLTIVEDIVRNKNKTVVMITHNPEIAKMADRVVKLRGGKIASVRVNMKPVNAVDLVW